MDFGSGVELNIYTLYSYSCHLFL